MLQALVDRGKAASMKMEQLQQSVNLLQAARSWASDATAAIHGLPSLDQVLAAACVTSIRHVHVIGR